jgi:hypothetical protein
MDQKLMRVGDWELALHDYVSSQHGEPFEYGIRDCIMFAMGAVEAMTGDNPASEHRGSYSTEIGASKLLHKLADGSVEGVLNLHFPTIPIGFARRGDLALSEGSVGIVIGGTALFIGAVEEEEGEVPALIQKPRPVWEKAWAVG